MSHTTLIADLSDPPPSLWAVMRLWWRRAVTRMDLSEVPEHILRDIGVTKDEARREAKRPFWRD